VATPVSGDRISLTNSAWSFSIEAVRRELGIEQLTVLNDFTAQALAVPLLKADDLQQVGGGVAVADQPLAVLGPGTGLGVSGLIPCNGGWVPLSGEGGHVTFSPFDDREVAILSVLRKDYPHVSAERLISGMGLVNLYEALAILEGRAARTLTPAEISDQGKRGTCDICAQALASFCAMLGTVTANLVLTLGATGGVYLGGGIIPRLGDYFGNSGFRERFETKGRFSDYLAAVPSYVIHAPNPALTGLAAALGSTATDRQG
jgi:glucokinase